MSSTFTAFNAPQDVGAGAGGYVSRRARQRASILERRMHPAAAEALEKRRQRIVKVKERMETVHTDIYAHTYDPFEGTRIAAGTSRGYVNVIAQAPDGSHSLAQGFAIPEKKPITFLEWGLNGLSLATKSTLHFYKTDAGDLSIAEEPVSSIGMPSNIVGMCIIPNYPERVVVLTENRRGRIYDINTEKLLSEFTDHQQTPTVCKSSGRQIVTGGLDGAVYLYDAGLRSIRPIWKTRHELPTSAVAISEDQSYIAVAEKGSATPFVHNLRADFVYGRELLTDKMDIRTIVFGTNAETFWGGTNGILYYAGLGGTPRKIVATYGEQRIPAINSITIPPVKAAAACVSVAGDANSLLISNPGCQYWVNLVTVLAESFNNARESSKI